MTQEGHDVPTADEPVAEDTGVSDVVEEGPADEPLDAPSAPGATPVAEEAPSLEEQLAERTSDLQRLSAEYANYRKRIERDRQLIVENATYKALTPIIEVLDTIDRAREHHELEGGFKVVAEQLEKAVTSQGLVRFGEPGEPFDPTIHDALTHLGPDPEVSVTTCRHIAKKGYRFGDRVVRAAQVVVVDPPETEG